MIITMGGKRNDMNPGYVVNQHGVVMNSKYGINY